MQVEIINPLGKVSYRRPHNSKDVKEALKTPGYSIRITNCTDPDIVRTLDCEEGTYRIVIYNGDTIVCSPVSYNRQVDEKSCELMTIEKYLSAIADNSITDHDGYAAIVKDNLEASECLIFPSQGKLFIPNDATHVAWYEKN